MPIVPWLLKSYQSVSNGSFDMLHVSVNGLLFHNPGDRCPGTIEELRNLLQSRALGLDEKEPNAGES